MEENKITSAPLNERRPKQEIWNMFFLLLFLESLFMGTMVSAFNSANALYVSYLNGTAFQRALMVAAFPTAALLTRLSIGRTVETHSRRTMIVIGLSIIVVMSSGFLVITNMYVLILLRFGQGVGMSIAQTTSAVACTDVVSRKRLGEGLGYYSLTNFFNQAVMPAIVVKFTDKNNYRGLFIIAIVALLAGIACTLCCRYEKKYPELVAPPTSKTELAADPTSGYDPERPITKVWMIFEKRAIPCTMIAALSSLAGSTISNYLLLFAKETNISKAALFFTLQAFAMFITRLLTSKMIDKYGSFKVYVPGICLTVATFVCLCMCTNKEIFYYIAGPLYGMGTGLIVPALNAAAVRSCPESRRSIASSTYMLSSDIALGLGGFLGSFIINLWGYGAMFIFSFICYGLSFSLAFWFFCIKNKGKRV